MTNFQHTLRSRRRIGVSYTGDAMAERVVVLCLPFATSGPFDPRPITTRHAGVQVISIDRPGYGASDPLPDGEASSTETFADDIAEYARDREQRAAQHGARAPELRVVGWEFGACVALCLASRHPDLVRNVVIVSVPSRAELLHCSTDSGPAPVRWDRSSPELERLAPGIGHRLARLHDDSSAGQATDRAAMLALLRPDDVGTIRAPTTFVYAGSEHSRAAVTVQEYRKHLRSSRVARVPDVDELAIVTTWRQILRRLDVEPVDE